MNLIRKAVPTDNRVLCELFEHAMQGSISIAMERHPNFFFGSQVQCEQPEVFVVCDPVDNDVLGVFSIGTRRVWLNGQVTAVRYFSDLRLKEGVKRAQTLFAICNFISNSNFLKDTVAQTLVFDENTGMNKIIDLLNRRAKKHHVFQYYKHGAFVSHMIHLSNKIIRYKGSCTIRKARQEDIPLLQQFLEKEGPNHPYFPFFNFNELKTDYHRGLGIENFYISFEESEIVGLLAWWDQSSYKQTRIKSYARYIHMARPFINLWATFLGGFSLPKQGESIKYASLHCILIKNQNPKIFDALIHKILEDLQISNFQYLLCGLPENHPFQPSLQKFKKRRTIKGNCYLVSNEPHLTLSNPYFYVELGRI